MKRFGSLAALLAVVLMAGACSRSSSPPAATGPTVTNGGGTTTPSGPGPGDFGTLKDVCGPGSATPTKASDKGVTASEIHVATSSDPGFAGRRGLNQELFDAGDVFTAWCNAAGGIAGRKIVLDEYDAALFNFDAQINKACAADFFLVGNGNVFDNNPGQRDRLKCLLPEIPTYMVTLEGRDSDLTVQPVPNKSNAVRGRAVQLRRPEVPGGDEVGRHDDRQHQRDAAGRRPGHRSRQATRLDRQGRHPLQPGRRDDVGALRATAQGQGRQGADLHG